MSLASFRHLASAKISRGGPVYDLGPCGGNQDGFLQTIIASVVTCGIGQRTKLRDSGVPRLCEIPAHWHMKRLRILVQFVSGASPDTGNGALQDGNITWISPECVKVGESSDAQDHVSETALSNRALQEEHRAALVAAAINSQVGVGVAS